MQGNAIIYVSSRKEVERVRKALKDLARADSPRGCRNLVFLSYHGARDDRAAVERTFLARTGVVVVATVDFGLGIDCPLVRLVVHVVHSPLPISNVWYLSRICLQGVCVSDGAVGR